MDDADVCEAERASAFKDEAERGTLGGCGDGWLVLREKGTRNDGDEREEG